MKKFLEFIKESGVPVNVTGINTSTDKPVVTAKASSKYKDRNKKEAPKPIIGESDYNSIGDSFEKPDEAGLYRKNSQEPLKISKKTIKKHNREA